MNGAKLISAVVTLRMCRTSAVGRRMGSCGFRDEEQIPPDKIGLCT